MLAGMSNTHKRIYAGNPNLAIFEHNQRFHSQQRKLRAGRYTQVSVEHVTKNLWKTE